MDPSIDGFRWSPEYSGPKYFFPDGLPSDFAKIRFAINYYQNHSKLLFYSRHNLQSGLASLLNRLFLYLSLYTQLFSCIHLLVISSLCFFYKFFVCLLTTFHLVCFFPNVIDLFSHFLWFILEFFQFQLFSFFLYIISSGSTGT